jgi:hypothetical protein
MSTRTKSPNKVKNKRKTNNIYDIVQFKKMIGKDMVRPCNNVAAKGTDIKKTKERVLLGTIKRLYMKGYINNGILFILDIDKLNLVAAISYSELKKANTDLDIYVEQYGSKLTKEEIYNLTK